MFLAVLANVGQIDDDDVSVGVNVEAATDAVHAAEVAYTKRPARVAFFCVGLVAESKSCVKSGLVHEKFFLLIFKFENISSCNNTIFIFKNISIFYIEK